MQQHWVRKTHGRCCHPHSICGSQCAAERARWSEHPRQSGGEEGKAPEPWMEATWSQERQCREVSVSVVWRALVLPVWRARKRAGQERLR